MSAPYPKYAKDALVPENTSKTPSDSELWEQFRKGSDAAFIQIYEQYFDRLYAYGMRISMDESLTKDAIQEVFFDLKKLRQKVGPTDHIRFYLMKCLKRKLYQLQSHWEGRRQPLASEQGFDFVLSAEQHLIDQQLDQAKVAALNRAISLLSTRKKEIIYYFFYEGLSYAEIRDLMGMDSDHSTRNLMYKALGFLRKTLG